MSGRSCRAVRETAASASSAGAGVGCPWAEVGSSFSIPPPDLQRQAAPKGPQWLCPLLARGAGPQTAFGKCSQALLGSRRCAGDLCLSGDPCFRGLELCSPGFWLSACGSCLACCPHVPCAPTRCSPTCSRRAWGPVLPVPPRAWVSELLQRPAWWGGAWWGDPSSKPSQQLSVCHA